MPSSMVLISVKKVLRFSISLYKSVLCAAHDFVQLMTAAKSLLKLLESLRANLYRRSLTFCTRFQFPFIRRGSQG